MTNQQEIVVIVDAYSSGDLLAPEFARLGLSCIHVASPALSPSRFSRAHPEHFLFNLAAQEADALADELRSLLRFRIAAVVPGAESGVEFADALTAKLGLPGNSPRLSRARRSKDAMAAAFAIAGVPHITTATASTARDVDHCFLQFGETPIVLKPAASAGTDSVFVCRTQGEAVEAFDVIRGTTNIFGAPNDTIVVQPLTSGEEYVVDTVSWDGRHVLAAFWRTPKVHVNGRSFVSLFTELLHPADERVPRLQVVALRAIDALEIRYGAAHVEIIDGPAGPVVVELGARCHGAGFPRYAPLACDRSQVTLLAHTYALRAFPPGLAYKVHGSLRIVELIADRQGTIAATPGLRQVRDLPSYRAERIPNLGARVGKTVDVLSSPGIIVLAHEHAEVVEEDYQTIRSLESQGALLSIE